MQWLAAVLVLNFIINFMHHVKHFILIVTILIFRLNTFSDKRFPLRMETKKGPPPSGAPVGIQPQPIVLQPLPRQRTREDYKAKESKILGILQIVAGMHTRRYLIHKHMSTCIK